LDWFEAFNYLRNLLPPASGPALDQAGSLGYQPAAVGILAPASSLCGLGASSTGRPRLWRASNPIP
jgi:hypothetical protein